MRITTTTADPYTVNATIALERDELASYVRDAKERLAQEVTIEGFRKGKAPKHLVEPKLGEEAVRAEALEAALGESFTKAAQEQGWDIARTTDLNVRRNDAEGLEYSILVHLWPAVTMPDLAVVKVSRHDVAISEAEVDEALDTVRNMRSTFLDKTGAAAVGDRVEVDFDAFVDGAAIDGGSSRNHPLVIGGKTFMPGFEEELVGLASDMSKEFSLTAPADYYEPKLAGKKVDFKVTVKKVQAMLKPAADDELAKSLGQFADLAALRASLQQGLTREKEAREQQRVRLAILDDIIAKASVPAPDDMVDAELGDMVHRFEHDLRSRGIELPMYLARLNKTEEQLKADWRLEAQRQVRIMLVLRQFAKDRTIDVDPAELELAFTETVAQIIKSGQATEEQVDAERIRKAIAERLLRDKVLQELERACTA